MCDVVYITVESPGGPTAVRTTSFFLITTMPITMKCLDKSSFSLDRVWDHNFHILVRFQENKLLFYSSAMLTFQQLFILFIIHCLLIPLQIELFLQSSFFLNKISPVIFSWPLPICLKLIMLAKAFWELSPNPSSEIEWQYIKQCFWWKCQFWSSLQLYNILYKTTDRIQDYSSWLI